MKKTKYRRVRLPERPVIYGDIICRPGADPDLIAKSKDSHRAGNLRGESGPQMSGFVVISWIDQPLESIRIKYLKPFMGRKRKLEHWTPKVPLRSFVVTQATLAIPKTIWKSVPARARKFHSSVVFSIPMALP